VDEREERPVDEGHPDEGEPDEGVDPRKRRLVHRVTGALIVVLVLGTGAAALIRNASGASTKDPSTFGVPLAAAGCQPVITDKIFDAGVRVGPGTSSPDVTRVDYATTPPSSGRTFAMPVFPNLPFYANSDVPQVEQLVLNLQHGYTILWYDPTLSTDEQAQLDALANRMRADDPKIIAAPWDITRGRFAGGAMIAMSHWGTDAGYRQLCAKVSGEAVQAFVTAHPTSQSPDPGGA
jgi:hypothetical protein